jgi:hypothetical protein
MDDSSKMKSAFPDRMNTYMTTEHFTLQGARSIINAEITSRITIYFTTLSSVIIAAAFVAQIAERNQIFVLFGSLAFPLVILLGFFSAGRLAVLVSMDAVYIRAINRIRHYYVQSAPEVEQYLLFPPYDDARSIRIYAGWTESFRDGLLSSSNAVITSNSIVTTVLIGALSTNYYEISFLQFLPIGIITFLVTYILHWVVGYLFGRPQSGMEEYMETRFPKDSF